MPDFLLVCTDVETPVTTCEGVATWVDVRTIQNNNPLTEFNLEHFGIVNGSLLLSFLVGHGAGRVVRWMGR